MDFSVPHIAPFETQGVLGRNSFPEGKLSDTLANALKEAISKMSDEEFNVFWKKHERSIHPKQQKFDTLAAWFTGGKHPLETGSFTSIMTSELEKRQIEGIKKE